MKIIQSFWTLPSIKREELNHSDRNIGGWSHRKFNYMSWALSCLQLRNHYDQVELVTDHRGKKLLIDQLELPYTSVQVVLDELNGYHPDLWALGKIYAYGLQEEPFLHLDGDIYLWHRLGATFETSSLVAQNQESDFSYYREVYQKVKAHFTYIPEAIEKQGDNGNMVGINAGILGGTDVAFIREYAGKVFEFVNQNREVLHQVDIGLFNTFFEQYFFQCLVQEKGLNVSFYKSGINDKFDGLAEFTGVPEKVRYIHPVGTYKKMPEIGRHVANRLRADYPGYYYKIENLLRTHQI